MAKTFTEALEEAQSLASWEGVELVAQGEVRGKPCILVLTSSPDVARKIPQMIQGHPVVVEPSTPISAQERAKPEGPKSPSRP